MTAPTQGQLDFLQSIDTPTVCNLIEVVAPARRGSGYTVKHLHCPFPDLPPIVGFARTVTFKAKDAVPLGQAGYMIALLRSPKPTGMAVFGRSQSRRALRRNGPGITSAGMKDARGLDVTTDDPGAVAAADDFAARVLRLDQGAEAILDAAERWPEAAIIALYAAAFWLYGQTGSALANAADRLNVVEALTMMRCV